MRVDLPGIHKVTSKGKDYYYAWRGGPRLTGEPCSAEFVASYNEAHASLRKPDKKLFRSAITAFKQSAAYTKSIRKRTQKDYSVQIAKIEAEFGDLPIAALDDPRITTEFRAWRDKMANSPRQADYAWTVLMRIISWMREGGQTSYRPPERIERLYQGDRSEIIWEDAEIAAFIGKASKPMIEAMVLAADTGQRQGDLLALTWSAYDGTVIKLRQSKTGMHVTVPLTSRAKNILDSKARGRTVTIMTDSRGRPWNADAFRKAWRATAKAAEVTGKTFHDLRGTAVTRLAEVGCTPSEIATITGHSMRDIGAMLDRYMKRTGKLAFAAIAKLERGKE
ncbi:MAG: tyrosine-type recombinase/integrase [Parvibaculaceae bacterium]